MLTENIAFRSTYCRVPRVDLQCYTCSFVFQNQILISISYALLSRCNYKWFFFVHPELGKIDFTFAIGEINVNLIESWKHGTHSGVTRSNNPADSAEFEIVNIGLRINCQFFFYKWLLFSLGPYFVDFAIFWNARKLNNRTSVFSEKVNVFFISIHSLSRIAKKNFRGIFRTEWNMRLVNSEIKSVFLFSTVKLKWEFLTCRLSKERCFPMTKMSHSVYLLLSCVKVNTTFFSHNFKLFVMLFFIFKKSLNGRCLSFAISLWKTYVPDTLVW